MSYALFEDDTELSRGFNSYDAAFKHADDAGLTDKTREKPMLIDGFRILEVEEVASDGEADDKTAKDWTLPSRVNSQTKLALGGLR